MPSDDSLYLVLPVPFRIHEGRTFVEAQAANGLDRWADNFARVTVAAPVIPEALIPSLAGFVWRDTATLEHRDRVVCQPLPWAYTPAAFIRQLAPTRRLLARSIAGHQYLQFAIGGLIGDWAAIAALEAIQQGRPYAIHTDRVEHELIRKTASSASPLRKLRIALEAPLMQRYHRRLIRHCALGLWHGEDCFRAYSPWASNNHLIHDIHTKSSDLISAPALAAKLAAILTASRLDLIYTGRLDPMKAPLDWLRAIAHARSLGAAISATWFGEGALLEEAKSEAIRLDLNAVVRFPGFVANRTELLRQVASAHALVFTHITPESPRNLIESLVVGTPILGYANPYAENLLDPDGGGSLVPIHDHAALGTLIARLAADRPTLAALTRQAAQSGRRFTDAAVFSHRSHLIRSLPLSHARS